MKINLHSEETNTRQWEFVVEFLNDSTQPESLPVDAIKRNGIRLGLQVLMDGIAVEPVEFTMISPRQPSNESEVPPGNGFEFKFLAVVEEKASRVFALCFKNEAYKINLGEDYEISFIWGSASSNVIKWRAE